MYDVFVRYQKEYNPLGALWMICITYNDEYPYYARMNSYEQATTSGFAKSGSFEVQMLRGAK